MDSRSSLFFSLGAVAAFVVCAAISAALASELPCRVCRHPALKAKRCRKHERARAFLGISHPLTVALCVLFTNRFRCFYCGEKIPLSGDRAPRSAEESPEADSAARSAAAKSVPLPAPVTPVRSSDAADRSKPAATEASHLPERG